MVPAGFQPDRHSWLYRHSLCLLFVDFLDIAGTLTSVANLTGRVNDDGEVADVDRALLADSTATVIGSLAGTSNTTSTLNQVQASKKAAAQA